MALLDSLMDIMSAVWKLSVLIMDMFGLAVTILLYTTVYNDIRTIIIGAVMLVSFTAVYIVSMWKLRSYILREALLHYIAGKDKRIKTMLEHTQKLRKEINRLQKTLSKKDVDKNYVKKELERKQETYRKLRLKLEKTLVQKLVEDTDEIIEDLGKEIVEKTTES